MTTKVPLTVMDAELLDVICAGRLFGRPLTLFEILDRMDWKTGQTPTFEELSYGLARLVARGYITAVHSPQRVIGLKATRQGTAFRREAEQLAKLTWPSSLGRTGVLSGERHQVAGTPPAENDHRSAGRLPDFTEQEWQAAVEAYRLDSAKWIRRAGQVGGLMRRFLKWRRPEDFQDPPPP